MLVERTTPLVDHDAIAVRGGSDTLIFYAQRLTSAQRRVLRTHLLVALSDDEPCVTIAVPAGWAAAEVPARRRSYAPLTVGTILVSAAAAVALAVFVAAVVVLVADERDGGPAVAQASAPPDRGRTHSVHRARGTGHSGAQPSSAAPVPPDGGQADGPAGHASAARRPDGSGEGPDAAPVPPVLAATAPDEPQLTRAPSGSREEQPAAPGRAEDRPGTGGGKRPVDPRAEAADRRASAGDPDPPGRDEDRGPELRGADEDHGAGEDDDAGKDHGAGKDHDADEERGSRQDRERDSGNGGRAGDEGRGRDGAD